MSGSTFAWPAEAKNKYSLAEHSHAYSLENHAHAYSLESHTHAYSLENHTHSYSNVSHSHSCSLVSHSHDYASSIHYHYTYALYDHIHDNYIVDAARVPNAQDKRIRFTKMDGTFFDGPPQWLPSSSGVTKHLNAVAGYNNVFVAVGASGTIVRSTDGGQSWSSCSSGTTKELRDVSVSGAYCIAVGDSGTALYSRDYGATWALLSVSTNSPLDGVINSRILARWGLSYSVSINNSSASTSIDYIIMPINTNLELRMLLYGNSYYFVTGHATFIAPHSTYSSLGWVRVNNFPVFNSPRGCYGDGKFVFADYSNYLYWIDYDQINTNGISANNNGYIVSQTQYLPCWFNSVCCYGDIYYVAVGCPGYIGIFTNDLSSYQLIRINNRSELNDVCCDDTHFVAVGNGGAIFTALTSSAF